MLEVLVAVAIAEIGPQAGPQEAFLSSRADIVIAGGAAGGGKTFGLLMEPLRHISNGDFGAVVFRRTYPQIKNEGGLWDEAGKLYPHSPLFGKPNSADLSYRFPSDMTVTFSHLQHTKDAYRWTGAQVPLICFDQLEEFEEGQFWYLLTRNRSARAGVAPYVRATCNPVPADDEVGGWLHRLISWWIDEETGYAIPERSGVVRWFVRADEQIHWADSSEEIAQKFPGKQPKSLTFIPATLADNPILEKADPTYRAMLEAMPLVERERLLNGNWKIKPEAGKVFNRAWFAVLAAMPGDVTRWVRYWDKAGTEGGGKYTAGVLMGRRACGRFIVAGVVRGQWSALNREKAIKATATTDADSYESVDVWVEQEPGSGGKESAENTVRNLAGHVIRAERVTGSKLSRAAPLAAQAEAGNVDLLVGPWNEAFLHELHNFDGQHGIMDQVDAASGAFNKLARMVDITAEPLGIDKDATDAVGLPGIGKVGW